MIRIFIAVISVIWTVAAVGQTTDIGVRALDTAGNKVASIANATVLIQDNMDSAVIAWGITDGAGLCLLKHLSLRHTVTIYVSAVGYTGMHLTIEPEPDSARYRKVVVRLSIAFEDLEDAVVAAVHSPMKMIKDTLEFDPVFFKTGKNAVLEDLLITLPGIQVSTDGSVFANGQRVSRILIEGKEYFSADPTVILRNLPAEIIGKVQLADERNTIAREIRMRKDIPRVINLKLKKEVHKGIFGKVFGGQGTVGRREAGALTNLFRDTLQVSFIGAANNEGRNGFSMEDLNNMGGFSRSQDFGNQSDLTSGDAMNAGIQQKKLAGANINYNASSRMQLNMQYFYKERTAINEQTSFYKQLMEDSVLYSVIMSGQREHDHSHVLSAGFKYKKDPTSYLMLQLQGSWSASEGSGTSTVRNYSEHAPELSSMSNQLLSSSRQSDLRCNLQYAKTFTRQNIDWTLNLTSYNDPSENTLRQYTIYKEAAAAGPDTSYKGRTNPQPVLDISINNRWVKSLTMRSQVVIEQQYGYTGIKKGIDQAGVLHQRRQSVGGKVLYRLESGPFIFQAGGAFKTLDLKDNYDIVKTPPGHRDYYLFLPAASLSYKNVSLSFEGDLDPVPVFQLMPVTDSLNPLYIVRANPGIGPVRKKTASLSFFKFINRSQISITYNAAATRNEDALASRRIVGTNGATTTETVNFGKADQLQENLSVSKFLVRGKWNYSLSAYQAVYATRQPFLLNNSESVNSLLQISGGVSFMMACRNIFSWHAFYNMNFTSSDTREVFVPISRIFTANFANKLYVRLSRAWFCNMNIVANHNGAAATGFKSTWLFCDAALSWSFLKKDNAQIRMSVYDILNQNEGLSRSVYLNSVVDNRMLMQKRYFMTTLVYSFKKI